MTPNAFVGKANAPTQADLVAALGTAKPLWDHLAVDMARALELKGEWKSYGLKQGWSLRLKKAKRNIVYLSPCEGCIAVLFILGDKAVAVARASRLGRSGRRRLDEAPRYPEGTGVRLEVRRTRDLALVETLARIKLEN